MAPILCSDGVFRHRHRLPADLKMKKPSRSLYLTVDMKKAAQDAEQAPSWSQVMVGAMPKPATHYTVPVAPGQTKTKYAAPTPRFPIKAIPVEAPTSAAPVPYRPILVADAPRLRARPRRRLLHPLARWWATLTAPLDVKWLGDLQVIIWVVVVIAAVAITTPILVRTVPKRLAASKTTERMTQGYKDLFDAEEKVLRQTGNYIDPAHFIRDEGIAMLLDPQYEVLTSTADDSHWFLKVRSLSAGTVCTAISMTYLTRGAGGFKMECRKMDPREATAASLGRTTDGTRTPRPPDPDVLRPIRVKP